jgi:hypothetical protein
MSLRLDREDLKLLAWLASFTAFGCAVILLDIAIGLDDVTRLLQTGLQTL